MAKLLDLPNELIILIVSQFDKYLWKGELSALCLTSKLLCSIAQPFLYAQFIREVQCQCCQKAARAFGRIVPIVRFTRTLITRPDLAARVRSASFDASEDEADTADVLKANFDVDTIKVLADGFKQLPAENKASRFKEAVAMMSNPYLLLLSSLMPNLERLTLTIAEEGLWTLEPLFVKCPVSGNKQPFLQNLKSLIIRDTSHAECDVLDCLEDAMALPQLEDFTLMYINGDADGCPFFNFEPGTLNIQNLSLVEACLDADSLESMVAGCKCLKYFTYCGHSFHGNTLNDSGQFEPSELTTILDSQKTNLRKIRCNLDWEGLVPAQCKRVTKYGSFAEFENICHLEIDQYPWAEKQSLPACLHCLTIRNISFPILETIESLNERTINCPELGIHGDLPNLRRLTITPRDGSPNGMLEVRDRFDHLDVYEHSRVANKFLAACDVLYEVVVECSFHVNVDHEVFDWYMDTMHGY